MNFYIGVTDNSWYKNLSQINPEDVNFWQPGGNRKFRALSPGDPFLFKLKGQLNVIGGVGFFLTHTFLPLSIAWDTFHNRNGVYSFVDFQKKIFDYRKDKTNINPTIGCIVLTSPIFFQEEDWISLPNNWAKNIVQGKSYSTTEYIGASLWEQVESKLGNYLDINYNKNQSILEEPIVKYGNPTLTRVRIGQGAFRVLVTDAYCRKCAISGEKALPVLEAAHIKPYALSGSNSTCNGLLLRSDFHRLFDTGYITITKQLRIEVSKRIKEEFDGGETYYKYHGNKLISYPRKDIEKPHSYFIDWHNSNVYNG